MNIVTHLLPNESAELDRVLPLAGGRNKADLDLMKPKTVRLFIKSYCSWCDEASEWLDHQGVGYESVDVSQDREAMREMVALSGQSRAPVIEVDGDVLADFGADELESWWRKKGLAMKGNAEQ